MAEDPSKAPALEAGYVISLIERLDARIGERFPEATLRKTAGRLLCIARGSEERAEQIRRPQPLLRVLVWLLILLVPALVAGLILGSRARIDVEVHTLKGYVELFQTSIESLIFIGIGIAFLVTIEQRIRRGRALRGLQELRTMVHVVDMHQLDKDPAYLLNADRSTASSPRRHMTAYELNRYLDYCSELLSAIGKLAVLHGQGMNDPAVLTATDQLEGLCTGLSHKILQKLGLLDRFLEQQTG